MRQRFLLCLLVFLFLPVTLLAAEISFDPARRNFDAGDGPQFVVSGDINGDGTLDLAVVNSGSNKVSILLGNGDSTFQAPVSFNVGTNPCSVAIGDLNGDSRLDLVVANNSSSNVSILLGNGDGTFQAAVNFSAGYSPRSVAIGDLNVDGKPDLAVADESNAVILLGNGDGTFQAAVSYGVSAAVGAVGISPYSVAIGDLNGDGKPDLAVANELSNNISILRGNGDGTFKSAVIFAVGFKPYSVAIGDLNGDSRLDIVVANYGDSSVSILRGNGDGTFQTAVNYGVEIGPGSVVIGDLDGDGNPDLVVANYVSSVSVLRGNGDGSFQAAVNYVVGNASSVTIGDLNGDSRPDLAVANGSTVSILRGNGDGTFQGSVNYAAGANSREVVTGDLNGDGQLDLAVVNQGSYTVSILRGNGDGTFQAAVDYAVGSAPYFVAIGDLNGDSWPDLAVVNSVSNNVSILRGNGDGTFKAAVNYAVGSSPRSVSIGDLNKDGKPDLAVANYGSNIVSVLRGNGDGTFQAKVNYVVGNNPFSVAIGDLNADGKPDLAVTNYGSNNVSILVGNGDGSFQVAVNYNVGRYPSSVVIGDLNGDSHPDLAIANSVGIDDVSILRGNGDGTFQAAVNYVVGGAISIAIGDLNADGKSDLVVTSGSNVSILRGNGDGTLQTAIKYGAGFLPGFVSIGDFNADGKPDLAVANLNGSNVSILLNSTDLPVWTPPYPQTGTIDIFSAEVRVNADRDGTAYAICLPSGAAVPTSSQVRAGQNAVGTPLAANLTDSVTLLVNSTAILSCTSLSSANSYDIYTVAADREGSLQILPAKLTVTTDLLLYTVGTAVVGSNGTLNCVSPVTPGSTSLCTASPALDYHLATISGCGNGTQDGNQYTTAAINADCTVTATFVEGPATQGFADDFETGDLTKLPWQTSGAASWLVMGTSVHGGAFAAQSPVLNHYQAAALQITQDVAAGSINFWYRVSSEGGYDFLRFYIDNVAVGSWSSEVPWALASFPVTAGSHAFRWEYSKDGSVSTGSDTAWIDDVSFNVGNVPGGNDETSEEIVPTNPNWIMGVSLSGLGEVVWSQYDESGTYQIYSNLRGSLTSDPIGHYWPSVNILGDVVWEEGTYEGSAVRGLLSGAVVTIAQEGSNPDINDRGEVVWSQTNPQTNVSQIYSNVRGWLTTDAVNHYDPAINNAGDVVWVEDGCGPDGCSVIRGLIGGVATLFGTEGASPDINDQGEVVWRSMQSSPTRITSSIRGVVVNSPSGDHWISSLNNCGDLAYVVLNNDGSSLVARYGNSAPCADVEPDNSPAQAQVIPLGTIKSGVLQGTDSEDWYTFTAIAGETLNLRLHWDNRPPNTLNLEVLAEDGPAVLNLVNPAAPYGTTFMAPVSGTYTVRVATEPMSGRFGYALELKSTPVTIEVSRLGAGSGTVTSDLSHPGISCGDDCTEPYPYGATVTLTATPAAGSVFTGWSGACSASTTSTCTVALNALNTSAVAAFQSKITSVSLDIQPAGTVVAVGSQRTLTSVALGGTGTPHYQFKLKAPGKTAVEVQAFSEDNSWEWNTTGLAAGIYTVTVNARTFGSTASYEATKSVTYTVVVNPPVTAVSLTSQPVTFALQAGPMVTLNASATGTSGNYVYQFLIKTPGKTASVEVQAYSADSSWEWNTAGLAIGTYVVTVYAKNAGSVASYEAAKVLTFNVVADPPVTAVSLTSQPVTFALQAGPMVTLNASATGTSGNYVYQFLIKTPGQSASVEVQAYSADSSWEWNTAGLAIGTYAVTVYAKNAGSVASYEAAKVLTFNVVAAPPVTAVSLTAQSTKIVVQSGTPLQVVAAAQGGTGVYEYKFWWKNANGTWAEVGPYATDSTWTRNTSELPVGVYSVQVYARNLGSGATYEAAKGLTIYVTPPPATGVTLTATPGTPQPAGAQIEFSATGLGGTGTYDYRFWLRSPNGAYTAVGPYTPSSTWTWNTSGLSAGTYSALVYVRSAGSTAAYEAYKVYTYTLK